MDLTDTLAPTSDQLDAVDLLGGPRTFTVESVARTGSEQPVSIRLVEFPRVWRPGKSMRRVLVAAWGPDGRTWAGRRVTLYCDPGVKYAGEKVGGTRISHLSHIDKPLSVPLIITRGKSAVYTVQPLTETPARAVSPRTANLVEEATTALPVGPPPSQDHTPAPSREDIAACTDVDLLDEWARTYTGPRRDAALARIAELTPDPDDPTLSPDWPGADS